MIYRALALALPMTFACIAPGRADNLPDTFVRLSDPAPGLRQDIRYATRFNFVGDVVPGYEGPACILTKQAAEALLKAERRLNEEGLALKTYDCYRPATAVNSFVSWVGGDRESRLKHVFYPDIDRGKLIELGYIAAKSSHSRGSTVDVGLVRLTDPPFPTPEDAGACDGPMESRPRESSIDMGTSFDCFSPESAFSAKGVSAEAHANRTKLRSAMVEAGFRPYEPEWWHFTLDAEPYPDTSFDFPVR